MRLFPFVIYFWCNVAVKVRVQYGPNVPLFQNTYKSMDKRDQYDCHMNRSGSPFLMHVPYFKNFPFSPSIFSGLVPLPVLSSLADFLPTFLPGSVPIPPLPPSPQPLVVPYLLMRSCYCPETLGRLSTSVLYLDFWDRLGY